MRIRSTTGTFKPIFLYNGRDGVATDPNSGLDISLSASIYSPSVTFSIENYTVTISLDLGVDLSLPFAFGEDWFQLNGTNWSIKIQREK